MPQNLLDGSGTTSFCRALAGEKEAGLRFYGIFFFKKPNKLSLVELVLFLAQLVLLPPVGRALQISLVMKPGKVCVEEGKKVE